VLGRKLSANSQRSSVLRKGISKRRFFRWPPHGRYRRII